MQLDSTNSPQATIPTPAELKTLLLEQLNISIDEQQDFLEPKYELANPMLFADMEKAVIRIQRLLMVSILVFMLTMTVMAYRALWSYSIYLRLLAY
jgi:hypothetical protein